MNGSYETWMYQYGRMALAQGVRSLYEGYQSFAGVLAPTRLSSNQGPSEISCRIDRKAGTHFVQDQLDRMLDGKLVGRNPKYTTWSVPELSHIRRCWELCGGGSR